MRNAKRFFFILLIAVLLIAALSPTAYALEESAVQEQVNASGKEAVAGNVFIWFLCAMAFLKVSQKIDSFMSSLGINVGHTGGSMLTEAMIAARSFGGLRGASGGRTGSSGGHSGGSGNGEAFLAGGLAGVVSRSVSSSAAQSVTNPDRFCGIGGSIYGSSVAKGGSFANNVIGSVATGDIASMGTITGEKAAEAMNSYMGYAAMEPGAKGVPTFSDVEIGGGRITGTETSQEHPEGIAFGMYNTDQYTAPEGDYTTVFSADGASWYKQYAPERYPHLYCSSSKGS